jgi:hypothetical protein
LRARLARILIREAAGLLAQTDKLARTRVGLVREFKSSPSTYSL